MLNLPRNENEKYAGIIFFAYALYCIGYGIYMIAGRQEIVLGAAFVAIGATQGVLRFYRPQTFD